MSNFEPSETNEKQLQSDPSSMELLELSLTVSKCSTDGSMEILTLESQLNGGQSVFWRWTLSPSALTPPLTFENLSRLVVQTVSTISGQYTKMLKTRSKTSWPY